MIRSCIIDHMFLFTLNGWLSYKVAEVSLPTQNGLPASVGQHQSTEKLKTDKDKFLHYAGAHR